MKLKIKYKNKYSQNKFFELCFKIYELIPIKIILINYRLFFPVDASKKIRSNINEIPYG